MIRTTVVFVRKIHSEQKHILRTSKAYYLVAVYELISIDSLHFSQKRNLSQKYSNNLLTHNNGKPKVCVISRVKSFITQTILNFQLFNFLSKSLKHFIFCNNFSHSLFNSFFLLARHIYINVCLHINCYN